VLLLIVILPLIPVVKSFALIVPDTPLIVQYNVVPFGTLVVVTVAVALDPSLRLLGLTDTE
jgi:hypothetical protein